MKKLFYIIAVLFFGVTQANAQRLYVEDCDAPLGGTVTIAVKYSTGDVKCEGGQMNIDLPEGLSFVTDADGNATGKINPDIANGFTLATSKNGFAVYGTGSFTGEGTLLTFDLNVSPSLSIGDVKEVTVRNLSIPTADADIPNDPFTFKVTIVENRITLDENSTTAPAAAENVNVLVKRSVKAGNWGTICLPFAMTEDQVKAVFGDGAKLADFDGTELIKDEEELISEIKVKFVTATSIAANHPYLLKSENDIKYEEGFKVEGVTIKPTSKPTVSKDYVEEDEEYYSFFYGVYVPTTLTSKLWLFLSGNKFYYSNGETNMKGFRGYFKLQKPLAAKYKDLSANARISIAIDEEPTVIDGMGFNRVVEGVYDLSGRKIQLENGDLNKLQKGVYIIDGKKVTIK